MTERIAYVLGTWFGCGRSPVGPGTVGTLGTLPLYFLVWHRGALAVALTALVVTAVGIWASNFIADHSQKKDPQFVVIDEAAGVLVTLTVAPPTLLGVAASVALFRLFDITKPWPIKMAERLPRGWGIMVDDLVAGVWAAGCVLGLRAGSVLS